MRCDQVNKKFFDTFDFEDKKYARQQTTAMDAPVNVNIYCQAHSADYSFYPVIGS
ncbi:MAG: hypothetical protein KUL83_11275 [Lentimicrobium sp.]|jgi:hypothetical protein|nr:hypothetical protein [Lentimicrobium sp.]MDD2528444.1 hypothetical protein [Lentimicrobiaceae bacterium]MDY0026852.1 hypothetical protein [Lentimicrobium sp.]